MNNNGNTEKLVDKSETNLNDDRFLRILENSRNMANDLRDVNAISRKKFGELVGHIPIPEHATENADPDSWVTKVLIHQDHMYAELYELRRLIDSV